MNQSKEHARLTSCAEKGPAGLALGSGWDELLYQCAQRDHDALAALYDQASRLVYGVALRILMKPEDAEEVTMDVFIQVWRTAAKFDPSRSSAMSWLVLLARSRAIDRIRFRAERQRREEPIEDNRMPAASDTDPEEALRVGQLGGRVRNAMQMLSAEQRHAVELAFFSGLTHAELARNLGVPLGTAKSRIRSSMIKLRESLGEYA